jgi:hypothetical protein
MAASEGPGDREPLIIISRTGSPSVLFYSNRPVVSVPSAADLSQWIEGERERRAILPKQGLDMLSADVEVNVLATAGNMVYATLKKAMNPPSAAGS